MNNNNKVMKNLPEEEYSGSSVARGTYDDLPAFDDFDVLGRLPGLEAGPSKMDEYWGSDGSDFTLDSASCEDDDHELPPDLLDYDSSDEDEFDEDTVAMVEALPPRRSRNPPFYAPHLDIEPFVSSFDDGSEKPEFSVLFSQAETGEPRETPEEILDDHVNDLYDEMMLEDKKFEEQMTDMKDEFK